MDGPVHFTSTAAGSLKLCTYSKRATERPGECLDAWLKARNLGTHMEQLVFRDAAYLVQLE